MLNVNGPFDLASRSVGGSSPDSGTFIINGGIANINGDILDASTQGTRTTTLALAGGTLNMNGHAIGSTTGPITKVNLPAVGGQATLANLGGNGITTIANPGGGLLVDGGGLLNLAGVNTYLGDTTIDSGALSVIGSIAGSGTVRLNGGALIGNGDGITTGTMGNVEVFGGSIRAGTTPGDIGTLTMTGLAIHAGNLTADFGAAPAADRLVDSGNLTLGDAPSSSITLTVSGTQSLGSFEIIDYSGQLIKNADFTAAGPLGFTYSLDYNTPGKVFVNVATNPSVLLWNAASGTTTWDFAATNFLRGTTNVPYSDGMPVSFNDLIPPGMTGIDIAAVVSPSIVSIASTVNNFTFGGAGAIGGTGRLVKDGGSTLTILTDNSYSGGTTISGGTIVVGNGGTSGSLGSGPIADSGALAYNREDVFTVANPISGSGSLQQLGAGTLILAGNNSYGATFIAAGATLQIGNGGAAGTLGTGLVTNNGTLLFDRSDGATLTNAISGPGSIGLLMPGARSRLTRPTAISARRRSARAC